MNQYKYLLIIIVFLTLVSSSIIAQTATPPAVGDGSGGDPYQIATLNNLYWITQNSGEWDKAYIQTADIDLTGSGSWDSNSGFSPIGNNATKFTGSYNGQGYTISNLRINRNSSNNIGLFGYTTGATIQNLVVTDANVIGHDYVGVIVGYNHSSTISNCKSEGILTGNIVCGGLVGQNISSSTISKCVTDVDVNADNLAGGFVGANSSSIINNCYTLFGVTTTRVAGDAPSNMGAFCGNHGNNSDSKIEYCYSIGGVSFVVHLDPTDKGFIAVNNNGGVTANFFDTEVSAQTSGTGATAKTTADMKTASTFLDAGWDAAIWNIGDGINDGYPYLDWQNPDGTPLPVELVSFEGFYTEDGVLLRWETATEVNNYGFEVQKSEDRIQNSEWTNIGFVLGHGTTNSPKQYSFTDTELPDANEVSYRLKQIDNDGTFAYSKTITVDLTTITSVDDELIYEFALEQNYPNPFNPATTIKFTIPSNVKQLARLGRGETSNTKLVVYDILGREVATLVNKELQPGNHEVSFNASSLSSGMYFYRVDVANDFSSIKKMLLIK